MVLRDPPVCPPLLPLRAEPAVQLHIKVRHLPVAGRLSDDNASAPLRHNNQGRTAGRGPAASYLGLPPGPTAGHMAEVAETSFLPAGA